MNYSCTKEWSVLKKKSESEHVNVKVHPKTFNIPWKFWAKNVFILLQKNLALKMWKRTEFDFSHKLKLNFLFSFAYFKMN